MRTFETLVISLFLVVVLLSLNTSVASAQCQIVWTDRANNQVRTLGPNQISSAVLIDNIDQPSFLALDKRGGGRLFISSRSNGRIYTADLDGSNLSTLMEGLDSPTALAVDTASEKLYWLETAVVSSTPAVTGQGIIKRSNLDGSGVETVVSGLSYLGDIAVSLSPPRLYWTESVGFDAMLKAANLDGSSVSVLGRRDGNTAATQGVAFTGLAIAVETINETADSLVWFTVGRRSNPQLTPTTSASFDRVHLSDLASTNVTIPPPLVISLSSIFAQVASGLASSDDGNLFWADSGAFGNIQRFDSASKFQNSVTDPQESAAALDLVIVENQDSALCEVFPVAPGSQDAAIWRPASGTWFFRNRFDKFERYTDVVFQQWGLPSDAPLLMDTQVASIKRLAVWRPDSGNWFICSALDRFSPENFDGTQCALRSPTQFGLPGDLPLTADFDGDARSDLTVWRPFSGEWFTRQSSDENITVTQWGLPGDIPLTADFDGDGVSDLVVWRPTEGSWYARLSSRSFSSSLDAIVFKQWGLPEDHPMPGDYDGDNESDLVVWRPSTGTWFLCFSSNDYDCSVNESVQFGLPGDIPVSLDFDGDGRLDYVVWRPGTGTWFYRSSATNIVKQQQWGLPGDFPIPGSRRDFYERL